MSYTISPEQKNMCKKLKEFKSNNKENKKELFLVLEQSTLNLILKSDLTATSRVVLIYFLFKIPFNYENLLIPMSYKLLEKETGIKKATAINCLKDLHQKGFINLHSGTNRILNNMMKENVIFKQKQIFNPERNQQNIIEMTPFFEKLFKVEKWY